MLLASCNLAQISSLEIIESQLLVRPLLGGLRRVRND